MKRILFFILTLVVAGAAELHAQNLNSINQSYEKKKKELTARLQDLKNQYNHHLSEKSRYTGEDGTIVIGANLDDWQKGKDQLERDIASVESQLRSLDSERQAEIQQARRVEAALTKANKEAIRKQKEIELEKKQREYAERLRIKREKERQEREERERQLNELHKKNFNEEIERTTPQYANLRTQVADLTSPQTYQAMNQAMDNARIPVSMQDAPKKNVTVSQSSGIDRLKNRKETEPEQGNRPKTGEELWNMIEQADLNGTEVKLTDEELDTLNSWLDEQLKDTEK